ncbi:hypothetical protein D3C78_1182690 [compost metagenome]
MNSLMYFFAIVTVFIIVVIVLSYQVDKIETSSKRDLKIIKRRVATKTYHTIDRDEIIKDMFQIKKESLNDYSRYYSILKIITMLGIVFGLISSLLIMINILFFNDINPLVLIMDTLITSIEETETLEKISQVKEYLESTERINNMVLFSASVNQIIFIALLVSQQSRSKTIDLGDDLEEIIEEIQKVI